MNNPKSISLIFPLYRDKYTVKKVIDKSLKILKKLKIKYEIIIIDDYCPEKSGLVAKVFNNADFDNSLKEIALKIANQSKPLAKLAKQAVNIAYETNLEEGVRSERALFYSTFALEDHVEGMQAFSEKRKPAWRNK